MLLRLLFGLLKGIVIGGGVGYLVGVLGTAAPPVWLAYLAAGVVGVLIALVAGKPIWRKGALVEVGMKAVAGAILAPLLMLAARSWLTVGLPFPDLPAIAPAEGATLGTYPVTALAMIAALLGAFYDADNSDKPEDKKAAAADTGKRIAAAGGTAKRADPLDFEEEEQAAERKARK